MSDAETDEEMLRLTELITKEFDKDRIHVVVQAAMFIMTMEQLSEWFGFFVEGPEEALEISKACGNVDRLINEKRGPNGNTIH